MSSHCSDPTIETPVPKTLRSPWPYAIVSVFVLLAIYDAGIVTLALRSQPGVVEARPYETGLGYEQVLEAKRAASRDSVRWQIETRNEKVVIRIEGLKPEEEYQASIELLRPDDASLDIRQRTAMRGPIPTQELSPVKSGLWVATIDITGAETRYRLGPEKIIAERRANTH